MAVTQNLRIFQEKSIEFMWTIGLGKVFFFYAYKFLYIMTGILITMKEFFIYYYTRYKREKHNTVRTKTYLTQSIVNVFLWKRTFWNIYL